MEQENLNQLITDIKNMLDNNVSTAVFDCVNNVWTDVKYKESNKDLAAKIAESINKMR